MGMWPVNRRDCSDCLRVLGHHNLLLEDGARPQSAVSPVAPAILQEVN